VDNWTRCRIRGLDTWISYHTVETRWGRTMRGQTTDLDCRQVLTEATLYEKENQWDT